MKDVKLVIADIDGTLYGHERIFTKRTVEAINEMRKQGILFGLASGRDIANMRLYPAKWGFDEEFDVYVGMNGAMLYDTAKGTESKSMVMPYEDVVAVYEYLKHFDYNISFFAEDGVVYAWRLDERTKKSMERNKGVEDFGFLDEDITKLNGMGCYKVCYRVPEEEMPALEEFVKMHPTEKFNGFKTQPVYYEVMYKGVNKALGVRNFIDANGISPDQVIAFGDTTNDVEMLAEFNGVCLCDGSDDAKAVASDITTYPSYADGFAEYVETHILKK